MILHVLRALFILSMAAGCWFFFQKQPKWAPWILNAMLLSLGVAVIFIAIDILSPRKKLLLFAGTFIGLLVGILLAYVLGMITQLVADQWAVAVPEAERKAYVDFIKLMLGIICCYLAISFIMQTKDDFRFIIPYVEFAKQTKGPRPIIVDTSVIIDGRIVDIAESGVIESRLIVPRFVLTELQAVADSADRLKRNRGRRGLDMLAKLQAMKRIEVIIYDSAIYDQTNAQPVDEKLLTLAHELNGRVLTNDFNLSKVAQLRNVDVVNINDLANALKPVVLPGEKMQVRVIKPGEEPSQGVGYLADGTMVVIEQGRQHINDEVELTVTSVLQTSAGRMIFGRMGDPLPPARKPRTKSDATSA